MVYYALPISDVNSANIGRLRVIRAEVGTLQLARWLYVHNSEDNPEQRELPAGELLPQLSRNSLRRAVP